MSKVYGVFRGRLDTSHDRCVFFSNQVSVSAIAIGLTASVPKHGSRQGSFCMPPTAGLAICRTKPSTCVLSM